MTNSNIKKGAPKVRRKLPSIRSNAPINQWVEVTRTMEVNIRAASDYIEELENLLRIGYTIVDNDTPVSKDNIDMWKAEVKSIIEAIQSKFH